MSTSKAADTAFEDKTIEKVEDSDTHWAITCDGWTLCIPKKPGIVPKPGDVARHYGRGIGYPVRGVDVNGLEVFYETERQYEARQELEQLKRDVDQRNQYLADKDAFTARINALPGPLQKRLFQFRERSPDFGWKFEGYELACAEMAAAVAKACERLPESITVADWLKGFHEAPWETQASIFGKSADGASGNMVGFSIRQARLLLEHPELVPKDHGALCILVGCEGFKVCESAWSKREAA